MKTLVAIAVIVITLGLVPAYLVLNNIDNNKQPTREVVSDLPLGGPALPPRVDNPPGIQEPPVDELPKVPVQPKDPVVVRNPPPKPPIEPIQRVVEPPIFPDKPRGVGLLGQYWQDSFFGAWPLELPPRCSEKGPRHPPESLPKPNLVRNETNFKLAGTRPLGEHEYSMSLAGFLQAPSDGVYEFNVVEEGGDAAWLYIDKLLVVYGYPNYPPANPEGQIRQLDSRIILAKGSHEIVLLRWDQCALGGGVNLLWKGPGISEFSPIRIDSLTPKNLPVRPYVADVICRVWYRCPGNPTVIKYPDGGEVIIPPTGPLLPLSSVKGYFDVTLTGSAIIRVPNSARPLLDLEIGKKATIQLAISSRAPIDVSLNLKADKIPNGIIVLIKPETVKVQKNAKVVVDIDITALAGIKTENKSAAVSFIAQNETILLSTDLLVWVPEVRPNGLDGALFHKAVLRE